MRRGRTLAVIMLVAALGAGCASNTPDYGPRIERLTPEQRQQRAADQVIDVPTRPGVTERVLLIAPDDPRATVVLFAGDDGGLQIAPDGQLRNGWLAANFLVRSRRLFA